MISKGTAVTLLFTVIGLIIMIFSYIKIRKVSKVLKQLDKKDVVPDDIVASLLKYQGVLILGMVIALLSQIIGEVAGKY